jgi:hypothetical protein
MRRTDGQLSYSRSPEFAMYLYAGGTSAPNKPYLRYDCLTLPPGEEFA